MEVLQIKDLHISVGGTPIINGISMTINKGEVHAIMGRNGAGKSTLANAIMGHPAYEITSGSVTFLGKPLDDYEVHERARAGMFLSFQYPPSIPGVQVGNFLKKSVSSIRNEQLKARDFRKELNAAMSQLEMDKSFLSRSTIILCSFVSLSLLLKNLRAFIFLILLFFLKVPAIGLVIILLPFFSIKVSGEQLTIE